MIDKIHILISLLAALCVTIISLYQDITFFEMCNRLVVIIPAFYIFGLFFRSYMRRIFAPKPPPKDAEKEDGTEDKESAEPEEAGADLYDE